MVELSVLSRLGARVAAVVVTAIVAQVVFFQAGCDAGSTTVVEMAEESGRLQLELVGVSNSGTSYRLSRAIIVVQGPSTTLFLDSDDDPDATTLGAVVPVGPYTAFLQEGWVLERLEGAGKSQVLEARLASPNPLFFVVEPAGTTRVPLRFVVGDEAVATGTLEVSLEVVESAPEAELCQSDADCGSGETCCFGGFLGTCLSLAPGQSCPLPDLTVSEQAAAESLRLDFESFAPSSCAIQEGCVDAPGVRRLLRFATQTANVGDLDIVLGDPNATPGFEFAACHGHFHFEGYAEYQLLDAAGNVAASGHKQAFCLLDSERVLPGAPATPRFHCNFQGIQRGWSDVYDASLDCQWVDVTDVAAGDYVLRIQINPGGEIPESNHDNNVAEIPVHIDDPGDVDPLAACSGGDFGPGRDCGWAFAPKLIEASCTPGEEVVVGCGGCATSGLCSGDPVLRVCEGGEACAGFEALALSDDSCSLCPETQFTCPASGAFSVMTAAFAPGEPFACEPVTTQVGALPGLTEPCGFAGPDRDCGWSLSPAASKVACEPGESIMVGCQGCGTGGTCAGDPMLRVCAGSDACSAVEALAASDDSCSLCPETFFTCPAEGAYSVMTGAFQGGSPFTCDFEALVAAGP